MRSSILLAALVVACNPDPGEVDAQVGYRPGDADTPSSGERGSIKISEILWSGSVDASGERDQSDVFIELRNESNRAVNLSGWYIVQDGTIQETWRIPDSERMVAVGEHVLLAARNDRCFPEPDFLIEGLRLPDGDPFELVLLDADERLIEPAGDGERPPFAGGWDLVKSRSMERVELMFGGQGHMPQSWHFYTDAQVDEPNNDRILESCRTYTLASPGRPNSPDYSGAYSTGSFE